MPAYMKKKKAVKKPKKNSVKKVVKPKDRHSGGNNEMRKAMRFVSAVQKAMKAYGK